MKIVNELDYRTKELADYMIETRCTIREVAKVFDMSKSTVFLYLTERLKYIDSIRYHEVQKILQYNKSVRSSRGGRASTLNRLKKLSKKVG